MRTPFVLSLVVCLAISASANAQPDSWSVSSSAFPPGGPTASLNVLDLASGEGRGSFPLTNGFSGGAFTADGQFFLHGTLSGIAVYQTSPPAFAGIVGPHLEITDIYPSASGSWVHVVGPAGYGILDARTGAIVHAECCVAPKVFFTPDGQTRVHVVERQNGTAPETVVTAYPDAPGTSPLWQVVLEGDQAGDIAMNQRYLVLSLVLGGGQSVGTVVLDPANGTEIGRLPTLPSQLALHEDSLFVSLNPPVPANESHLVKYTLPGLTVAHTFVRPRAAPANSVARHLRVSSDGLFAYWFFFDSIQGTTISTNSMVIVNLTTETMEPSVTGPIAAVYVDKNPSCTFDAPETVTAPSEGGVIDIPVTATGACRPWSVADSGLLRVLNAGPHPGSATLRVLVPAAEGPLRPSLRRPGGSMIIEQEGALPGAPDLAATVGNNSVTLTWTPGHGGGVSSFAIRGAVRGETPVPVVELPPTTRSWTSPPLPPGSYVVDVVAQNAVGTGAPSSRIEFSVGLTAAPEAPTDLTSSVVDDFLRLTWQLPAAGPAPANFVVEAASSGSSAFVEVARTSGPLFTTRIPAGVFQVRVRAATAGAVSPPSNTVDVTQTPCAAAPAAPSNLWALISRTTVTLRFTAPPTGGASDYVVEVGSASGLADLGRFHIGPQTSYQTAAPLGLFYLRVRAINACGESVASNEAVVGVP